MLPAEVVSQSGAFVIGRQKFQLVSDRSIVASVAPVDIDWLDQRRMVRVLISEDLDALIGAELLDGNRLVVDYVSDEVTLTSE